MTLRAKLRASGQWYLALAFLAALPAHAEDPLKKVRIAFAGPALSIAQPWLQMPGPLGYWRQEGLDVDVFLARGSLQAIQLLIAGQADVVQINSWPLVQAATNNGILIRDLMLNTVIDWQLVVPQDSPIKTVRDFKGKTIGTSGLPGMAFLKSYLKAGGLDPDRDVQIVPTGAGMLAGQALANKKVQGLFYRGSVIAGLENSGSYSAVFPIPSGIACPAIHWPRYKARLHATRRCWKAWCAAPLRHRCSRPPTRIAWFGCNGPTILRLSRLVLTMKPPQVGSAHAGSDARGHENSVRLERRYRVGQEHTRAVRTPARYLFARPTDRQEARQSGRLHDRRTEFFSEGQHVRP